MRAHTQGSHTDTHTHTQGSHTDIGIKEHFQSLTHTRNAEQKYSLKMLSTQAQTHTYAHAHKPIFF